jgi:hypothetical protein
MGTMKTNTLILAAVSAVALGGTAIAAKEHGGMMAAGPVKLADVEAKVRAHFAMLDTNKDGVVEQAEAGAAREKMRDDGRDAHFKAMDANNDGSISRAEFDAGHADQAGEHGMRGHHSDMRSGHGGMGGGRLFGLADANSDGKVTLAEALAKSTEHFKAMDANKDGTVTSDERKAARGKMRDAWHGKHDG